MHGRRREPAASRPRDAARTLAAALAIVVAALAPAPSSAQTVRDPALEVRLVASGLGSLTTMAFIGPSDLLVLYSDPEFSWRQVVAPTGLAFASARLGAQYANQLFVADFNGGRVHRFALDPSRTRLVPPGAGLADLVADTAAERDATVFAEGFQGITDLKVGPDGLLYVVSHDGSIHVVGPALSGLVNAFYSTALGRLL